MSLTKRFLTLALSTVVALLGFSQSVQAQYIGATFGYNYGNDLAGPDTGTPNTPLYNPDPKNTNATWDTWVREAGQAGLDFLCPNLRGASPISAWSPANMAPILTALNNSGFASQIKICAFDDNASSWTGQWSNAHGNSSAPFDISDSANWTYIYDTNYKIFFQTIPDANRFKINGRPVIIIWTGNPSTVANEQGHYSAAMTYVRQKCQADFGFNPFIIVNEDALKNDTTLAAVVDGAHSWNSNGSWSLSTLNNVKVGVAEAGLRAPGAPDFQDPNHGTLFQNNLTKTVGAGAVLTLIEGFTDWEETATLFRVRDLDPSGNAVDYSSTLYDYPNQRLDIIRQHSQSPFPASLLFEAEGADYYGGAAGGNGKTNFYRNGNIAIEATTDTGGGFDVGWMQAGEWLEWEQVPLNSTPHFLARIATSSAGSTAHLVIDGVSKASQTLPNTGGFQNWITFDLGAYGAYTNSYHTVRMVFDNGGVNFNWWQLGAGTTGGSTGTGGATGAAGSPGAGGVTSTAGSTGVGGTGGRSGAAGGAGLEGSMGQGGSVGTAGTVGQGGDNAAAGSHNEGGSSGGNDNGTAPGSPASTSGCSCRVGKSASGSPWLLLGSIALAIAAMRRIAQATASRRERTANSRVAHFDL